MSKKRKIITAGIAVAFLIGFFGISAVADYATRGELSRLAAIGLILLIRLFLQPVIRIANRMVDE